ncbi:MAG: subclass B1 metallo-beta-lactamase, partial [Bacteroidota bacterium]
LSLSLLLGLSSLRAQSDSIVTVHKDIEMVKLSERVWVHRSYMTLESYGRIYSNGMVYVIDGECMLFDTPMTEDLTQILIDWIEQEAGWTIKGIVVNHFHADCLGGLRLLHEKDIPSYAMEKTIELAKADEVSVPRVGVKKRSSIEFKGEKIKFYYPGEAHTVDNMVAYLPSEKVLFGGCMVKSVGAGKGNLKDANVEEWSATILKVKGKFPKAILVIPGHGKYGGLELLDYTMRLFGQH